MKEDLYALISLMLGELNASHLGITGDLGAPEEATADLGLIFDDALSRPGPEDRRDPQRRPGRPARPQPQAPATSSSPSTASRPRPSKTNVAKLLNDKVGEAVIAGTSPPNRTDPRPSAASRCAGDEPQPRSPS